MEYAVIAYNNTMNSVTKLTHTQILYGHINTKSILDIDLENEIAKDYIDSHKERTQKLNEHIKEVNYKSKGNIQQKRIVKEEPLPEIPQEIYVRTLQKQSKTKNKLNKEEITSVNRERKLQKLRLDIINTKEKYIYPILKVPGRRGKILNPNPFLYFQVRDIVQNNYNKCS